MKRRQTAYRRVRTRWTGLNDGEAVASWKLTVCLLYTVGWFVRFLHTAEQGGRVYGTQLSQGDRIC